MDPSIPTPSPSQPAAGPPPGWRPMSGLAVTSFVLSLLMLIALLTGWWWLTIVPFLLACFATAKAAPERYRGRGLAIAAIVICGLIGMFSFLSQKAMLDMTEHAAEGVLRPLDAEDIDEAERDHRLKDWIREEAVADGRLDAIKTRFAQVEEEMGPYQGEVVAGSLFSGMFRIVTGPMDAGLVQVDDPTEGTDGVMPGRALWAKAKFERGDVHVAVFLNAEKDTQALGEALQQGSKARVVKDVRFYLPAR